MGGASVNSVCKQGMLFALSEGHSKNLTDSKLLLYVAVQSNNKKDILLSKHYV